MGRNVVASRESTKTIKTLQSVAGFTPASYVTSAAQYKRVNCGALTANTLALVFSKTDGPCSMSQLAVATANTTSRTMRVVVEVDGAVAFDYTSSAIVFADYGAILAGLQNNNPIALLPIKSSSSLVVKVASNITETDKFYIDYAYQELN